ncbi:tetratricopeptide repeat protein [Synechococcus sp. HJ21-Hayes]|nr:tetratricopeptide repeat protein [Synechococcus sp. HJ21-Hayes]
MSRLNRSSLRQRGFGNTRSESSQGHSRTPQLQLYEKQVAPLRKLGRLHDAEPFLRLLLQSQSNLPEVYRDLGELAAQRGDTDQAAQWRDAWLEQASTRPELRWEQGCAAEALGRMKPALEHFQWLLEQQPHHLGAIQHSARLLLRLGNSRQALPLFEDWLEQAPSDPEARVCLSLCLFEHQQSQAAEALLSEVPQRSGANASSAWLQLGRAIEARLLQNKGQEQQALSLAQELLLDAETRDRPWPLQRLLCPLLLEQQRLELLQPVLEQALQHQPEQPDLYALKAECLLLQGQLRAGYEAFDQQRRLLEAQGQSLGHGCSLPRFEVGVSKGPLALIGTGTLGDTLLLSRYAPWLQEQLPIPVQLFVQPPLLALLQTALSSSIAVKSLAALAQQHCGEALPLASLPGLFGSCTEHPSLGTPNLTADPALIQQWQDRMHLSTDERLVGLNWHGSALQSLLERQSSNIPLETFQPVSELPGVRLLSLQKGIGQEQLETCSFRHRFVSIQGDVNRVQRLEHMAALMSLCHWVVTDDSGPAHLAGCLGIPGVVLLPQRINWRWGSPDADRHPWYPSLKLIRQQPQQAWSELVAEATAWLTGQLTKPQVTHEEPANGTSTDGGFLNHQS